MDTDGGLNGSSHPAPLLFPPRLNPEVAARKSRLILSLMVSLAKCGEGGGSGGRPSSNSVEGSSARAGHVKSEGDGGGQSLVADLVRQLLADKISPEEFQPRISEFLPATEKMSNLIPILNLGLPRLRESISRGELTVKGISVGFGQDESPALQHQQDPSPAPFDEDELTSMMEEVMTIN